MPAPRKPHNKVTGKRLFSHESISKSKELVTLFYWWITASILFSMPILVSNVLLLYILYFGKISWFRFQRCLHRLCNCGLHKTQLYSFVKGCVIHLIIFPLIKKMVNKNFKVHPSSQKFTADSNESVLLHIFFVL